MNLYSGFRLDAIHFDLSPNLSPKRREALNLSDSPTLVGKGLGVRSVLHSTEKRYNFPHLSSPNPQSLIPPYAFPKSFPLWVYK